MNTELLKAKILDLLIKGELTATWRKEHKDIENADVLLEKIRSEKEKKLNNELIAKGKKPTAKVEVKEVAEKDKPFEIPKSWKWCRLGDITEAFIGLTYKPTDKTKKGTFVLRSSNIQNNKIDLSDEVRVSCVIPEKLYVENNDILMCSRNGSRRLVGKSVLIENLPEKMVFGAFMTIIKSPINFYLIRFFNSPFFAQQVSDICNTTTINQITLGKLDNFFLPLPPLEEQKELARIAECLLTMTDDVESSYSNLEDLSKKAKAKVLDLLIKGDLTATWREEHKNIESADVLLEKIRSEKEKKLNDELIAKGKKPTARVEIKEVAEKDKPFEIPKSWKWCRFGDVFQHNTGKTQNSSVVTRNGTIKKFITTSNLYWNKFDFTKVKEMSFSESELERCTVTKGDLLICEGGDYGRSAIWKYDYDVCFQNHIHRARAILKESVEIIFYYYVMFLYKYTGRIDGHGVGIQSLSTNNLDKLLIPIPPLEEQKEIAHIADVLLNQIDSLTDIDSTQTGDTEDE